MTIADLSRFSRITLLLVPLTFGAEQEFVYCYCRMPG